MVHKVLVVFVRNSKWYSITLLDLLRKFLKLILSLKSQNANFRYSGLYLKFIEKIRFIKLISMK